MKTARRLVSTLNLDRKEWLKYRQLGIGGSDASVIFGINPFRSIHELWLEKTGQTEPEESENEYTHFGKILEPIVRQEFTRRTGLKVRAKNVMLQSIQYPFMLADLDGVINENGSMAVFEAKTASAYKKEIWEEKVPDEYILQVQHYMFVTGASHAYIAALVGGNHFFWYKVERNEKMIREIIEMEQAFWEEHVLNGVEPVPDGSAASSAYFNKKYAQSNGKVVQLSEDVIPICEKYDEISKKIKKLEAEKDAAANQIKNFMKENEVGLIGEHRISWKSVEKTMLDSRRLKSEKPEVYEEYLAKNQYRRLSVA